MFVPQTTMRLLVLKGPVSEQTLKVVLRCTPDPRKCFRSHNPLNSYAAVYRSRSSSSWSFLRIVHTSKRLLRWNVVYFALFCLFVCYCLLPPTYTTQKPWLFFQWWCWSQGVSLSIFKHIIVRALTSCYKILLGEKLLSLSRYSNGKVGSRRRQPSQQTRNKLPKNDNDKSFDQK